ncbi:hypothetical protein M514_23982 [Trichuris suis]|uniref:Uncharacterized protein n=1 Tax=Trichuris suis TaxID=68888 RepID=A0A085N2Y8_9BILA|nr:hypothetical protein M514_23982 [Trichuris suis]
MLNCYGGFDRLRHVLSRVYCRWTPGAGGRIEFAVFLQGFGHNPDWSDLWMLEIFSGQNPESRNFE